jgi:hypothetical protein
VKTKWKEGDAVTTLNVWKYDRAQGIIDKITTEYIVVKWDNIPGYWHYTEEQAERLEVLNDVD